MRCKATAVVLVLAFAVGAVYAQGGLALCVRPGMVINAAHIGYKSDMFFIGGGLEFASASWTDNETRTVRDSGGGWDTTYTNKYATKMEASVFLPQVAAKVFFGGSGSEEGGQAAGSVRPYVGASAFYSLAMVSSSTTYDDSTYKDTTTSRMLQDVLGGNLGGTVSFGGEYYISRSFAFSAEFGARYLFGGISQKSHYDYYSGYYEDVVMKSKLGLGLTYTTIGLNFYF
jgi:hypothetical protein